MTDTRADAELNRIIGEWHVGQLYVVRKHGLYYRPKACGYTDNLKEAWKIRFEEAKLHEYNPRGCTDPVTIAPAPHANYCGDLDAMHAAEVHLIQEAQIVHGPGAVIETTADLYDVEIQMRVGVTPGCKYRWHIPARTRAEVLAAIIERFPR